MADSWRKAHTTAAIVTALTGVLGLSWCQQKVTETNNISSTLFTRNEASPSSTVKLDEEWDDPVKANSDAGTRHSNDEPAHRALETRPLSSVSPGHIRDCTGIPSLRIVAAMELMAVVADHIASTTGRGILQAALDESSFYIDCTSDGALYESGTLYGQSPKKLSAKFTRTQSLAPCTLVGQLAIAVGVNTRLAYEDDRKFTLPTAPPWSLISIFQGFKYENIGLIEAMAKSAAETCNAMGIDNLYTSAHLEEEPPKVVPWLRYKSPWVGWAALQQHDNAANPFTGRDDYVGYFAGGELIGPCKKATLAMLPEGIGVDWTPARCPNHLRSWDK